MMLTNALGLKLLSIKPQPSFSFLSLIMSFIPQLTELLLVLQYTQRFVALFAEKLFSPLTARDNPAHHSRLTSWLPPLRSPLGGPLLHHTAALVPWTYRYTPLALTFLVGQRTPRGLRNGWDNFPMTSFELGSKPETKSIAKIFGHRPMNYIFFFLSIRLSWIFDS